MASSLRNHADRGALRRPPMQTLALAQSAVERINSHEPTAPRWELASLQSFAKKHVDIFHLKAMLHHKLAGISYTDVYQLTLLDYNGMHVLEKVLLSTDTRGSTGANSSGVPAPASSLSKAQDAEEDGRVPAPASSLSKAQDAEEDGRVLAPASSLSKAQDAEEDGRVPAPASSLSKAQDAEEDGRVLAPASSLSKAQDAEEDGSGPSSMGFATVGSGNNASARFQAAWEDVTLHTIELSTDLVLEVNLTALSRRLLVQGVCGGHDTCVISGNESHRIFTVNGTGFLELRNLTLQNGHDDYGGALFAHPGSGLALYDCVLSENRAVTQSGGVIACMKETTVTASGCTVRGNVAKMKGGFIYHIGDGSITIFNSTIEDNAAGYYSGGALYLLEGVPVLIEQTVFRYNRANSYGAAIFAQTGCNATTSIDIIDSVLTEHHSGYSGMLYVSGEGTLHISNCNISDNSALDRSSVLHAEQPYSCCVEGAPGLHVIITSTDLSHNRNDYSDYSWSSNTLDGGIISVNGDERCDVYSGTVTMSNCLGVGNSHQRPGGVLQAYGIESVLVEFSTFTHNRGLLGGAISTRHIRQVAISNCISDTNMAMEGGALLFSEYVQELAVSDSIVLHGQKYFTDGIVAQDHIHFGALWIWHVRVASVTRCTFFNNTAGGSGGAIYSEYGDGELAIIGCNFTRNMAGAHSTDQYVGEGILTSPMPRSE
ncbi:hypothetical protein CYMTET_29908 [Cymbomonas tetramitiformis]|uniref:Right handed beta helix domain-containing protein n=1 Tax=Cymbomonas tetramitiformis TaxID=36881 RepID=A0AAE0FK20_9CHLO|nr:hypothetical protein CYMTET_29908 [Cymbomonas tetramitiformis]